MIIQTPIPVQLPTESPAISPPSSMSSFHNPLSPVSVVSHEYRCEATHQDQDSLPVTSSLKETAYLSSLQWLKLPHLCREFVCLDLVWASCRLYFDEYAWLCHVQKTVFYGVLPNLWLFLPLPPSHFPTLSPESEDNIDVPFRALHS